MYQNTGFAAGKSQYALVLESGLNRVANFTSQATSVPVTGGKVPMVSSTITVVEPVDVTIDPASPAKSLLNSSVKLSYTVPKGDGARFMALLSETERLIAIAREQYNLDNGLVPPASATFVPTTPES